METLQPFSFTDPQSGQTVAFEESYRDEEGSPYATAKAIGSLLQYSDPQKAVDKLLERKPYILEHSTPVNLTGVEGGIEKEREVRVFSPIAVFLICMESNTQRAREIKLTIARFLDAWRRGEFAVSRIPSAARQLDGVAFIEFIRSQRLDRIFDQARRNDETGDHARGLLEALGFPKKPKAKHDATTCDCCRKHVPRYGWE